MTDTENSVKYVCQNCMPAELPKRPLKATDPNDMLMYYRIKCREEHRGRCDSERRQEDLKEENTKLKKQVDDLKRLLRILPILRRQNKDLSSKLDSQNAHEKASAALHEREIKKLKSELQRSKQENLNLARLNKNSTKLNPKRPNLNAIFKQKRILEANYRKLESEKESLEEECKLLNESMDNLLGK